jgi:hypothetical protein
MNADSNFNKLWSVSRVFKTWKALRKGLRRADARDCLDYLEFDLFAEEKIQALKKRIVGGTYNPTVAGMFQLAKRQGAYRVMSILTAEDALVYRHLTDSIFRNARQFEPPGVFFAQAQATVPVGPELTALTGQHADFYESAWKLWMQYHQYRTKTLLTQIHRVLVVTDITNYFESVQHELLLEYLAPLGLPRKSVGLLGKLLENFKPDSGYSPSPRVGLPVDQHDCSRALAHIFLFEHDRRLINAVGKNNYARWMDDQNFGVSSETEARKLISKLTDSLSQQRLVLNVGKTKFLDPDEVSQEFHLASNELLDDIEMQIDKGQSAKTLRKELRSAWSFAKRLEGVGHWDKIVKRFYTVTGKLSSNLFLSDSYGNLIRNPTLAPKIFEYFSALNKYDELLDLFQTFVQNGESVYESVEASFFENILCTNIPDSSRGRYRQFVQSWLSDAKLGSSRPYSRGSAALCLYWLGDRRSIGKIQNLLENGVATYQATTIRGLLASLVALSPESVDQTIMLCSKFGYAEVSSFAELLLKIGSRSDIDCTLAKVTPRRPAMSGKDIFEARTWLRLEILSTAKSRGIQNWLKAQKRHLEKRSGFGDCELRAYKRWSSRIAD